MWWNNSNNEDAAFIYHYDEHSKLTEKDECLILEGCSHSHHYYYDNLHRLVHYRCE